MKDKTPFEQAGYTEDTKFRVIANGEHFNAGDIVRLKYDDNSASPLFVNEWTGKETYMYLPGLGRDDYPVYRLEAYSENAVQPPVNQPTPDCQLTTSPTITHNLTIKEITHVLTTEELVGVWSIINRIIVGD